MNEIATQAKGRVRLFACGGGGINIGALFEKHRGQDEVGFAQIDTVYIDTSRSNMLPSIDPKNCYMLEGLDGSGKIRSENYEEISSRIRDILQTHKPGDLNIVLSTAAGGSGSVIAPSLVSELLSREVPVVVIAIGSADTRLDAENTLKTLKSYEGIVRLRNAPVVLSYVQNSPTMTRSQADNHVHGLITSLCALFSRQNRELDSKDLFNWLRFDRATTFPVQVAALTLLDTSSQITGLGNLISVATITTPEKSSTLPSMPEYQCVGFLPANATREVTKNIPLHFVTSDGVLPAVAAHLNGVLKELEASQQARIQKGGLLGKNDQPTATGLVL